MTDPSTLAMLGGSLLGLGSSIAGGLLGGKGKGDDIKKLLKEQIKPTVEENLAEKQAAILGTALFQEAMRQMIEARALRDSFLNLASFTPQYRQVPFMEGPRPFISREKGPDKIEFAAGGPYIPSEAFVSQPGVAENIDILAPMLSAFESVIPLDLPALSRGGTLVDQATKQKLFTGEIRPGQAMSPEFVSQNIGTEIVFQKKGPDSRYLVNLSSAMDRLDPSSLKESVYISRVSPGASEIETAVTSGDPGAIADALIRFGYARPKRV